ncbi:mediator of RNA polymerase II transcription subunit 10 [Plectosphaerella cucumerina]|uniref:Mediator of RNA polymerase II transcription subunit 10 n=1 Tax=Plectosphaerella cucumerina TaxID=40658 RepID=A0A8K0T9D4_9PEZI|nr:mediator of RNA polymerase II transcription subunit 10 [Plectosphaerella cucumerina]
MAPVDNPTHDLLEQQVKDTIQDLYQIMVQIATYSATPSHPSPAALQASLHDLTASLQRVHTTALSGAPPPDPANPPPPPEQLAAFNMPPDVPAMTDPNLPTARPRGKLPAIPPELVQYVENGRNPDIYTREFVELVRRGNQLARGKMGAFERFRDVLAGEMRSAMPEVAGDVDRVVEMTSPEGRA